MLSLAVGVTLLAGTPSAHAEEGVRTINGTQIFCRSEGTGSPLVVVHGGPGLGHDYLYPHFRQLASAHRVIFYDQRGNGRSAALADGKATIDQHVEDLEGVRASYGLETMKLAGQSWGAIIALNYALKYPKRVERLVLLEPAPGSTTYLAPGNAAIRERLGEEGRKTVAALTASDAFRQGDAQAFKQFMRLWMGAYFHDRALAGRLGFDYFDQDRVKKFFESGTAMQPYLTAFDLYPRLREITCPVLIIHGESDPVPAEAVTRMREALPNATLDMVKECGHFVHLEKPESYFPRILAFMR